MTNAEARFSISLRPRKPEGSLGRTAQDVHLDSHTAPELCAWALGFFHSLIPNLSEGADCVGGQVRGDNEGPFSGVTSSGRVWRRCRKAMVGVTLRASLSGTFLQTLPDLVRPLKGHSLSPRSCPATRSAPSERFGY